MIFIVIMVSQESSALSWVLCQSYVVITHFANEMENCYAYAFVFMLYMRDIYVLVFDMNVIVSFIDTWCVEGVQYKPDVV
jgi:hypothetical protein